LVGDGTTGVGITGDGILTLDTDITIGAGAVLTLGVLQDFTETSETGTMEITLHTTMEEEAQILMVEMATIYQIQVDVR